MNQIRDYREPGRGLVCWWLDRLVITIIASLFFAMSHAFCRVQVRGRKNMPHSGAFLCIANHPSTIGIFATLVAVFWPWILKHMAMIPVVPGKWKYVRWAFPILRHFNVIAVRDRSQVGRRTAIVRAEVNILTKVKNCVLWLFAEGTRTDAIKGLLNRFNTGVGRVVAEAKPTIVFVWDQGSNECCHKGQWPHLKIRWWHGVIPIFSRYEMTVTISKPISAADPATRLYDICSSGLPEEIAQKVADYLHDLCWAFAVFSHPKLNLERFEPVNNEVLGDLCHIIDM